MKKTKKITMKINLKKKYMADFNDEYVDEFQNLVELAEPYGVENFKITEMKRATGESMFCKYIQEFIDWPIEECGKNNCKYYEPNGKARICKYKGYSYNETKRKWRVVVKEGKVISIQEEK